MVVGDVGVAPAGTGRAERRPLDEGVNGGFPCSARARNGETTCHYFWNFVANVSSTDDEELTRALADGRTLTKARASTIKTIVVLEAQQRAILSHPRAPFYNLNIDAGALWARRLIEDLVARERGAQRAAE